MYRLQLPFIAHHRSLLLLLVPFLTHSCYPPSPEDTESKKSRIEEKKQGEARKAPRKEENEGKKAMAGTDSCPSPRKKGSDGEQARSEASSRKMERTGPDLRKDFSKKPQTFRIPKDQEVSLECKEGTRLHIPSGSFEKKNGGKIHGKVRIEVKEYYGKVSMIKADLGTRSGDRLLRSKGMVHVEAYANNAPCRIKGDRSLGISFPDPNWEDGMKLFAGRKDPLGRMDWELESSSHRERKPGYKPLTNDRPPKLKGGTMNLKIFLLKHGEYPEKAVEKDAQGLVLANVKIDSKGELQDIRIDESPSPILSEAATQTLEKMNDWRPARLGKENIDIRIEIPINFSLGEKAKHRKVFLGDAYHPQETLTEKAREYSYRVYETRELGWLNRDAFRDDEELIAQKFQLEKEKIGLRLLFEERNSLIRSKARGKVHRFQSIPKGKEVQLIAIGRKGERYRWANAEMTIGKEKPDLEYEMLNKEEMERKMEALVQKEGDERAS